MYYCPSCSALNTAQAAHCIACGQAIVRQPVRPRLWPRFVAAVLVVLIALWVAISTTAYQFSVNSTAALNLLPDDTMALVHITGMPGDLRRVTQAPYLLAPAALLGAQIDPEMMTVLGEQLVTAEAIQRWAGCEMALAIVPDTARGEPALVGVIASRRQQRALAAALAAGKAIPGMAETQSNVGAMRSFGLLETGEVYNPRQYAYAQVGRYLVISSSETALLRIMDVASGQRTRLATAARFTEAEKGVDEDAVVRWFFRGELITRYFDLDEWPGYLLSELDALGVGFVFGRKETSATVSYTYAGGHTDYSRWLDQRSAVRSDSLPSKFAEAAPANMLLSLESYPVSRLMQQLLWLDQDELGLYDLVEGAMYELEEPLGMDANQLLFERNQGGAMVLLTPVHVDPADAQDVLPLAISAIFDVTNPARAQTVLRRVAAMAEDATDELQAEEQANYLMYWAPTGMGELAFGSSATLTAVGNSAEAVRAILTGQAAALASQGSYTRSLNSAAELGGLSGDRLYIDVAQVRGWLGSLAQYTDMDAETEVAINMTLAGIRSVTLVGSPDSAGRAVSGQHRAVVVIEEQ